MNRSAPVGIVVLIVTVFLVSMGSVAAPAAMADTGVDDRATSASTYSTADTQSSQYTSSESAAMLAEAQDFDTTTFEITVHEDGSATWTFQHVHYFDENDSEEREAFEEFADEFESEETDLYERFTDQAERMTESGDEATDREMNATDFERSATIEDSFGERGIVEMSFTWEAFAETDGDTVEVGDVFENMYIGQSQSIVIVAEDDLVFQHVEPDDEVEHSHSSLENASAVQWSGEQQFLDGNPRAVLAPEDADTSGSGGDGSNPGTSALIDTEETPWELGLGLLFALAVSVGAVWYYRQGDGLPRNDGESASQPPGPGPASEQSPAKPTEQPAETTTAVQSSHDSADPEPAASDEFLTDEDRVMKLIRENGGRMKQVDIVDETGWSKSKVSMLLSEMEDDGAISKLRVGRENIISLEGFEPEATKSPFEE
ncbi:helix-turn-helix transcriptional regulator [Natronorubrum daqingense]|uniref:IclR helix-turn-helix domain-containing protein n=1 Tax=Natronorubrum daqingense TaxID=588898 RepID=A0A1N7EDL6_9EURY|nr:helix-turn-helix domain-containing protein [Natronorubrum daqingense]APX96515.1 hypothetical protein BB347_07735 [Natronorubrum daqingense]SIR86242.1 IclR helix-turn-helix domain-containing protein [Natronorubrum daqingense]